MASWCWTVPALSSILLLAGCSAKPPLLTYGMVSDFSLTDQNGNKFSSDTLNNHVWVADFIYTNCPGPCPRMSSQMHQVQAALAGEDVVAKEDARFVSFTVDPARDTPAVLTAYSKHFLADPATWYFLTGDKAALNHLSFDVFHLSAVDGTLEHSTRFTLVDRRGRIRGFYSTFDKDAVPTLIADAKRLLKERS
jgi:protein SCO1/2